MLFYKVKEDSYLSDILTKKENTVIYIAILLYLVLVSIPYFIHEYILSFYGTWAIATLIWCIIGVYIEKIEKIVYYLLNESKYGFILLMPIILPIVFSYYILIRYYIRKYPNVSKGMNDRHAKIKKLLRK